MDSKMIARIEIVKYRFAYVAGQPKIIIEMVKLLDSDGNYIKFAKMSEAVDLLSKYPVTFV